jgi:6-phosphogluconolactonase (cycloisomerase 2 family)
MITDLGNFFSDSDGQVYVFRVSGAGAATTLTNIAGSPYGTGGKKSLSLALSVSSMLLLAANASTRNLTVFSIDQTSGTLSQLSLQPANTMGISGRLNGVAFAPRIIPAYLPQVAGQP